MTKIDLSSVPFSELKAEVERRRAEKREDINKAFEKVRKVFRDGNLPDYIVHNLEKFGVEEYDWFVDSTLGKIIDHWDEPEYWYSSDLC